MFIAALNSKIRQKIPLMIEGEPKRACSLFYMPISAATTFSAQPSNVSGFMS